jgi:hypothetical protein
VSRCTISDICCYCDLNGQAAVVPGGLARVTGSTANPFPLFISDLLVTHDAVPYYPRGRGRTGDTQTHGRLGHVATSTGTIAEALQANEIDMIFNDIELPEGSRLDLMREVVARLGARPVRRLDRLRHGRGHRAQP